MPQKTKKEKMAASLHKKLLLQKDVTMTYSSKIAPLPAQSHNVGIKPSKSANSFPREQLTQQEQYFRQDMRKSLIIVAAIITLQVSLYLIGIEKIIAML